uniref:Uncharacterized protein n=1 Tax=Arundo donax TaxID=35708 RepID=A0A0A9FSF4_ARUDO
MIRYSDLAVISKEGRVASRMLPSWWTLWFFEHFVV